MHKSIFRTNHTYDNYLLESSHQENLSVQRVAVGDSDGQYL